MGALQNNRAAKQHLAQRNPKTTLNARGSEQVYGLRIGKPVEASGRTVAATGLLAAFSSSCDAFDDMQAMLTNLQQQAFIA